MDGRCSQATQAETNAMLIANIKALRKALPAPALSPPPRRTSKETTMQVTRIGGRRVLFVMATDHEYGPCLAERCVPVITGVGPVEAAIGTTQALAGMDALPDLIVSIGSAGSRRLPLGSIWQVASVSWRDMDASRIGFAKGVTPFADHPAELPLVTPIDWPVARLSTGANIVGGDDYAGIDADMVDMETFAVLRAGKRFGVPVMGLRGISDGPGELDAIGGWTAMLGVLDERLAVAVDRL